MPLLPFFPLSVYNTIMFINLLYAAIPYAAVGAGLLVFHNAWLAILAYHAGIAAVILYTKPRIPFRQLTRSHNVKLLIFSIAVGAGGGLLYLLWPALSVPPDIHAYMESIGLKAGVWPYFIGYYVLINPVLEEYYWRGRLGSGLKRPVLNDFLFAGYHVIVLAGKVHVFWLAAVFLVLSDAAWYWRQISRVSGGLLAAVLSHMAADAAVIMAIYLLTTS